MCGICGYVGLEDPDLIRSMTRSLAHRGPDGEGFLEDGDAALGHRRLSIIDLAGGAQPMENEDGSLSIVFNGEIYNYRELRKDLLARGHRFRTESDTEVIVHLWEDHGPAALDRLNGMFTFALWDKTKRELFVARDRLGIKPLYYIQPNGKLLFASEAKAFLEYDGFRPELDLDGVHEYLALRYSPGPESMLQGLRKLPAAHWLRCRDGTVEIRRWWTPPEGAGPFLGSQEEYLEGFAERFERSIQRRMIADVPVGAYLSGGLDSSVISAAMARLTSHPIRTYSVGFDFEHNELEEAAATAKLLGSRHTEIQSTPDDLEILPDVVYHLDEPVGDPITIPTWRLAERARQDVKVVLTGEGADETLGGYLFHKALLAGVRLARALPGRTLRSLPAAAASVAPAALMNLAFQYPASLGERGKLKVVDFLRRIGRDELPWAYRGLISLFDDRDAEHLYSHEFSAAVGVTPRGLNQWILPDSVPDLHAILRLSLEHWLPDLILTKQDKLTMANSLEGRVPYLDHELVEYLASTPPSMKISGGVVKVLLRRYAERLLPKETAGRKKMPFYFPLEKYFGTPFFQDLVADCLSEKTLRETGLFNPRGVAALRKTAGGGEFMHAKQLFSLVSLELWRRAFVERRRGSD